jgi:hypothetical protein
MTNFMTHIYIAFEKLKCNFFGKNKVLPVTHHATQRGNRGISILSPNLGTRFRLAVNNFFGTE